MVPSIDFFLAVNWNRWMERFLWTDVYELLVALHWMGFCWKSYPSFPPLGGRILILTKFRTGFFPSGWSGYGHIFRYIHMVVGPLGFILTSLNLQSMTTTNWSAIRNSQALQFYRNKETLALKSNRRSSVYHASILREQNLPGVSKLSVFYSMGLTQQPRGVGRCTMAHFVDNFNWFLANWTEICIMPLNVLKNVFLKSLPKTQETGHRTQISKCRFGSPNFAYPH